MKNLRKQRRLQVIGVTGASLVAVLVLLAFLPEDSFEYFRSPSQLVERPVPDGTLFRLGGLVEEGSLTVEGDAVLSFRVTDGGASVPVVYQGVVPAMFGEGEGMVGKGSLIDGQFVATEIVARHDETYMPAELVDALREQGVYRGADATDGVPASN